HHVAQEQVGPEAATRRIHARNGDRVADRAAGDALDVALVVVDIRQHHVAQRQEQDGEGEIQQQRQLQDEAQHMMGGQVADPVGGTEPVPARSQWAFACHGLLFWFLH
ncbi:conserved hypothetical protein, partial [Ricinus communis]